MIVVGNIHRGLQGNDIPQLDRFATPQELEIIEDRHAEKNGVDDDRSKTEAVKDNQQHDIDHEVIDVVYDIRGR